MQVLDGLAVGVGDPGGGTQVVGMVEVAVGLALALVGGEVGV